MSWNVGVALVLACATIVAANLPLPTRRVEDHVQARAEELINYRLPNNTSPKWYDIDLTTHVHTQTDFNFTGEVRIRLDVLNTSRSITLHQRQLTIGQASLVLASAPNTPIALNVPEYNSVNEFLTFTTATDLLAGSEYILTIPFAGILRTDDNGFYRSSYIRADGSRRWLATTQFEQTDARHGFPCFDEPGRKAIFSIRITHGSTYHALSNTPVVSSTPDSATGYTTTVFQATPVVMSPYLVAFVVSDFESKSKANSKGFVHRVFARPNAIEDVEFGVDAGIKYLDAFEEYFGIPYPFAKMDQIAIPDFFWGAMENWGLVTYLEDYLLYNEAKSTFVNKRNVATTISHEFAHQWFGNLVTAQWWEYIWLNEGFATLYEYYGNDWVFPEWKIMDTFVFAVVQNVMVSDALATTRPMTHYVEETASITAVFDNIIYAKSGCVLNMMMHALTEKSFKKGVISYLNKQKLSVANELDLFAELEKAAKEDKTVLDQHSVFDIFSSWSRQAGFPVLTVERNYANGDILLHQERYRTVNETTQSPSIWWIPYNVATASVSDFSLTSATSWLSTRTATIKEDTLNSSDWLLVNKRQTGYYRVKYDLQNYKLLSDALVKDHSRIHLASRSQLIDDAFDLARTERLSYDVPLDFIKYLEHELEYVPWASALRGLEYVDRLYAGNTDYANFKKYLLKQLSHVYHDAGLVAKSNEHHYRKQTRNQVIQWSCRLGSELCLNETSTAVNEYLENNVAIHQDHRATILCNGIRDAPEAQYKRLIGKLEAETDANERNRFIDALACTSNVNFTKQYLDATVGDETSYLKSEAERYRVFSEISGINLQTTRAAVEFLKANFDSAKSRYNQANVNRAITRLATFVATEDLQKEFADLLSAAETKDYIDAKTIATARATVAANRRWLERNEQDVHEWIRKNGSAQAMVSTILVVMLLAISQMF